MVLAIMSLFAAVVSLLATMYAWKHHGSPGSRPFGLMALAAAIWQSGYTCEHISAALSDLSAAIFWDNLEFLGATLIPAALLVFVLQYSGHRAGSAPWLWALLAVEPVVTSTLAWTNPLHGLIRGATAFSQVGPLTILSYAYGPWMWGSILYAYALMALSVVLLVRRYARVARALRSQIHTGHREVDDRQVRQAVAGDQIEGLAPRRRGEHLVAGLLQLVRHHAQHRRVIVHDKNALPTRE